MCQCKHPNQSEPTETLSNPLHDHMEDTFYACMQLSWSKNQDYASDEDPFANFRQCEALGICTVEQGILTRMSDKFARISNLIVNDREPEVKDEAVSDTLRDLINYSAILLAYIELGGVAE